MSGSPKAWRPSSAGSRRQPADQSKRTDWAKQKLPALTF